MAKDKSEEASAHQFGGNWTSEKLQILGGYLRSYTTALKDQPFKTGYIDAFAGTGYRTPKPPAEDYQESIFPDLAAKEPQSFLDGSARLALKTEPPFDSYIFIEKSRKRCEELRQLKDEFSNLAGRIAIKHGEANQKIRQMCGRNWRNRRAVMFLDPYGLQVEWSTLEAIASTRAVDMWLLFPLGIGVNRMLPQSGEVPKSWRNKLSALLGTDDWYDEFYETTDEKDLFGVQTKVVVKRTVDSIGRYFVKRLSSIFAGVAQRPKVLVNSTNCPLYLLCFAAGNPKGARVALRIANHLLKMGKG